MTEKPAVLLSDELIAQLAKTALCKISFQELTGFQYPWDVDYATFQLIKAKLDHIEKALRSANPAMDITCVITGHGAFWEPQEGLDLFKKNIDEKKVQMDEEGPYPVWKLTSSEIFVSHISNMRQLVLAAAHDTVLLEHLKDPLGNHHILFQREFENTERRVRILLDDISGQGENLEFAASKDVILLERVRVTQEMLNRGAISEKDLGYTVEELDRVQQVLSKRCEKDYPKFRQRLNGTYNQIRESLREGECSQLRRVTHWDMAFSMLGTIPIGFRGQSQLVRDERELMTTVVASREEEIGGSTEGQAVLAAAEETRQAVDPQSSAPPVPEEEPEITPEVESSVEEPPKRKKSVRRMAIIDRIRR